ncbi:MULTISPECIES: restriction endonuclease subunit S [Lactobacillales]
MKLKDVIQIESGKNSSRVKDSDKNLETYTYEDMVDDMGKYAAYQETIKDDTIVNKDSDNENVMVSSGDVVFSFVSSTAGIVSEVNQGKTLNQNFAKLIFDDKQIDPRYLCYCLNKSLDVQQQIAGFMEGITLRRIKPSHLKEIKLPIVDLTNQKNIGHSYFALLKRKYLQEEHMKQEEMYVLSLLEEQLSTDKLKKGK